MKPGLSAPKFRGNLSRTFMVHWSGVKVVGLMRRVLHDGSRLLFRKGRSKSFVAKMQRRSALGLN